jgi:(R)-2-hydroxyacyl-CoA dehydratese activating ATPase
MRFAGIDIGSRAVKLVVVDEAGNILKSARSDTGFDPMAAASELMDGVVYDRILATGYGRSLFEIAQEAPTVTEIKAHATGARACFPEARAVLDIGGQDSKAIALRENGKVRKFEMNDRCAAGTGKFLEIMARTLGFAIEEFGREALAAEQELSISSMCTVFAESEVTSLIAKGQDRRAIARGLHASVIRRAAGMINRVSPEGDIVFSGGVAQNPCMRKLLAEKLRRGIVAPHAPQMVGALGAALLAAQNGA